MFCKFLAFLCFVHKNEKKTLYFLCPSMQCLIHLLINDIFHLIKSVASFWKSTTGTDLNRDELLGGNEITTGLGTKLWAGGEILGDPHPCQPDQCHNSYQSSHTDALHKLDPPKGEGPSRRAGIRVSTEFLKDHNQLLDRNMLLMIKVVLVARFCSCIYIWKDGQGAACSNLEKLIALYDRGDAILVAAGNDGFRILKMLEAHCSLQ
jgi:hypothetical protein